MKLSTLLIVGLAGVLAYMVFLRPSGPTPSTSTSSVTGGNQQVGSNDPFAATTSAIAAVFNAIGSWAQTAPKTN